MFKVKSDVAELIGLPFLPIVQLFEFQVPLVSITVTSSPTAYPSPLLIICISAVVPVPPKITS